MEALKVYIAFTEGGHQFDGAVAPNEKYARAIVAYSYRGQTHVRRNFGEDVPLENFTVRHEPGLKPSDYLLWQNAAKLSAACAIVLDRDIQEVEDYLSALTNRLVESKKFYEENVSV
jgi:hypothetical protein